MKGFFNFLFNVFWVILVGIEMSIIYIIYGIINCILIIPLFFGVPKIYFKIVGLVFAPAGKGVELHFGEAPVRNVFWIIFEGTSLLIPFIYGGILCCTIIGIPLGLQLFKIGKYFLAPFGAEVVKK